MQETISIEEKRELYKKYGTTRPDQEYEQVDEGYMSVREIVDRVSARIERLKNNKYTEQRPIMTERLQHGKIVLTKMVG